MKVIIKCQKTIQESDYEPVLISCEIEEDVKDWELEKKLVEIRNDVQKEVNDGLEQWLER